MEWLVGLLGVGAAVVSAAAAWKAAKSAKASVEAAQAHTQREDLLRRLEHATRLEQTFHSREMKCMRGTLAALYVRCHDDAGGRVSSVESEVSTVETEVSTVETEAVRALLDFIERASSLVERGATDIDNLWETLGPHIIHYADILRPLIEDLQERRPVSYEGCRQLRDKLIRYEAIRNRCSVEDVEPSAEQLDRFLATECGLVFFCPNPPDAGAGTDKDGT